MSDDLNLIPRGKLGTPHSKPSGGQRAKPGGRKRGKASGNHRGDQPGKKVGVPKRETHGRSGAGRLGKQPSKKVVALRRHRVIDVATLVTAAATFLPWAKAGSAGQSGISTGDGKLVAIFAVIGFLLSAAPATGKRVAAINVIETMLAITASFICGYEAFQSYAYIGEWVGLAASVVWAVAGFIVIWKSQAKGKGV